MVDSGASNATKGLLKRLFFTFAAVIAVMVVALSVSFGFSVNALQDAQRYDSLLYCLGESRSVLSQLRTGAIRDLDHINHQGTISTARWAEISRESSLARARLAKARQAAINLKDDETREAIDSVRGLSYLHFLELEGQTPYSEVDQQGLYHEIETLLIEEGPVARRLETGARNLRARTYNQKVEAKQHQTLLFISNLVVAIVFCLALWLPNLRKARQTIIASEKHREQLRASSDELRLRNDDLELVKNELQQRTDELDTSSERLRIALESAQQVQEIAGTAAARFQELFQGIPIACFTCDLDGIVFEWNTSSESLFGLAGYEISQRSIFGTLVSEDEVDEFRELISRVFGGEVIRNKEWTTTNASGAKMHLMCSYLPLRNVNGNVVGVVWASVDITERRIAEEQLLASQEQIQDQMSYITEANLELQNKQLELEIANKQLQALATTDGLTGLRNHRTFQQDLERLFAAKANSGENLSMILMDVDKFKLFNDEFGHQAGDEVLKGVAEVLRTQATDQEIVARYGGEEFAIILEGYNESQAMEAAERFRIAIANAEWTYRQVTASFGVATLGYAHESRAELIEEADQALYASKRLGRNRSTHYVDIPTLEFPEAA